MDRHTRFMQAHPEARSIYDSRTAINRLTERGFMLYDATGQAVRHTRTGRTGKDYLALCNDDQKAKMLNDQLKIIGKQVIA